jgi:cellulose synthase/poly-beta-1,6-N-acetylglucosamine synthase-like glycosyltransferase
MEFLLVIAALPYFFMLLKIYKGLTGIHKFIPDPDHDPVTNISIVIACSNEERNITHLLNALSQQNYPAGLFEVIIVDDNSEDNTVRIASGYNGLSRLTVISNEGTGKKAAVRTGVRHAKAELIITTDADCRMGENWLSTIAAFNEKNNPDLIICPVQTTGKPGFFYRFIELEFLSLQGVTAGTAFNGNSTMCNGANLSFSANAYKDHVGQMRFDIASGDDIFLLHSIKKENKARIMWLESLNALVTTSSPDTYRSFLSQRARWVSKWNAYDDNYTIALGISTFIIIISQLLSLFLLFSNPHYLRAAVIILLIKSIPDFLILRNTAKRYGRKKLLSWFLPSQLVYPFYILSVVLYQLVSPGRSARFAKVMK